MTQDLLFLVTGFVVGSIAASIVWALSNSIKKKHQKSRQEAKEQVMFTIGELLADADAITGNFRCGHIDFRTFRRDLNEKINSITKLFRTNMHMLDVFFVKYTEQQIETHQRVMVNPERRRPDSGEAELAWIAGVETEGAERPSSDSAQKESESTEAEFDSSEGPEIVADQLESVAEQFEAVLEHPAGIEQEQEAQDELADLAAATEPEEYAESEPEDIGKEKSSEMEVSPSEEPEGLHTVDAEVSSGDETLQANAPEESQAVEEDVSEPQVPQTAEFEVPSELETLHAGESQESAESEQPQDSAEHSQTSESEVTEEPVSAQSFDSDAGVLSASEEDEPVESSSDSEIVFEMPVEEANEASDEETGTFEEPTWSEDSFEDFEASFAQFEAAVEEKSRAALSQSQPQESPVEQNNVQGEPDEQKSQEQPAEASAQMSDMEQAFVDQGYELPSEEEDQFLTETICFDRQMIPTDERSPVDGSAQEPFQNQNRMRQSAPPKGSKPPIQPDQQSENVQPPASDEKDQSAITGDDVINTIDNFFGL